MEKVKQGLQTLEECLAKQKNIQRIKHYNLRAAELEKIMNDLHARLDEVERKLAIKCKETRQEVDAELEKIGIAIAGIPANQSKTKSSIAVPLNEDAIVILRKQLFKHSEFVFIYKGKPIK